MALLIGRKIALGYLLALGALVTIGVVAYRNFQETNEDARWVTHTVEVLLNLESVTTYLKDAESNARGYLINGDTQFADDFRRAADQIDQGFLQLRKLTIDNASQQDRLNRLRPLIVSRRETSRRLIDFRSVAASAEREQDAGNVVREGNRLSREVQVLIEEIKKTEQDLLLARQDRAAKTAAFTSDLIIYGTLSALLLVGVAGTLITRSITRPLETLRAGATTIGAGNYAHRVTVEARDEVGLLAEVFNRMADQVQGRQRQMDEQDWLKTRLTEFGQITQGQRDLEVVGNAVLSALATHLALPQLTIYYRRKGQKDMSLLAAYAAERPKPVIAEGEGLVGQCVVDGKRVVLESVPEGYVVGSSLGQAKATFLLLQPVSFEKQVKAVIEAASFQRLSELQLSFFDRLGESLGIILASIESTQLTETLLEQSRRLTEELKTNQAELTEKNAELESQTEQLKRSEGLLQEQQEELRQSNEEMQQTNEELRQTTEEMEEKANLLAEQKREVEKTNLEIENAREKLERQAEQLELTSKYKSDFLANMSHELRTPLNSLLILSTMLSENAEANLTTKQVQYAKTIQSSGHDLLELINDILDLSKIEAGKVDLEVQEMPLTDLTHFAEATFRPLAESKKLTFTVTLDPDLPKAIRTDRRRLEQVVKNLLSNAFKFTERGSVDLAISAVLGASSVDRPGVFDGQASISFAVTDSGIGIPKEKQQLIFEAFRQADAGTARRFGGTGLGLSISRELARLLGGSLEVSSEPGQGSTFTLLLPATWQKGAPAPSPTPPIAPAYRPARRAVPVEEEPATDSLAQIPTEGVDDDRAQIKPGDLVLLIVEDDKKFASILVEFAREKKFKAVVARTAAQGMALAQMIKPSAVTLDLRLPDQDGWVVIDWLKHHPQMRHIPVHIISGDEERERSLRLGAVSYLQKPVTRDTLENALSETVAFLNRPVKELLVIEDDSAGRQAIVELIGDGDVRTTAVATGAEALAELEKRHFDCLVLDLGLPDMSGTALLKEIHRRFKNHAPPVIVYTGKDLSRSEETELRMNAESIIVKSVRSPERLLDETALFLHRVQSKLPDSKRRLIEQGQKTDPILVGRKVLVVDDDVRNIFAVTSALESYQMNVLYAESGKASLDILKGHPDIDVVLMDVMMPEMDGYEAIREIRKLDRFKKLPIISVTAKAMKGDREKCLEAGASDYISKPVDMDKLRSLLRVWLYR